MGINFKNALGVHQHTMGVRALRAEVLASNIANSDTPNYKARDIDFKSTLESYKNRFKQGVTLDRTNSVHFGSNLGFIGNVKYRVPIQPDTGDGNTVDIAIERNKFVKNHIGYNSSFSFLSSKFSGLKKVISGR